MTPAQALAFVEKHGIVLVSATGAAPKLTDAIAGAPVKGSWWGHPAGKKIFRVLEAIKESDDVLVCRLVGGKLTLVHRRLWPALARVGSGLEPQRVARVIEEHTKTGAHVAREIPFPKWVPKDVLEEARRLDAGAAWNAISSDGRAAPASRAPRARGLSRSRGTAGGRRRG